MELFVMQMMLRCAMMMMMEGGYTERGGKRGKEKKVKMV